MKDEDRQLIEQVLKAAGTAGERGFAYLVRYTMVDGILTSAGCLIALFGALWFLRRLWNWKPKNDCDSDLKYFFRGGGIIICIGAAIGFLFGLESSMVQAIMPEGAAISAALHR